MLRTWARAMAEYIYIYGTFLLVKRGNYPQKAYLEHFCLWNRYALYNTSKKGECQKLCQTSVSGWGSLGESNLCERPPPPWRQWLSWYTMIMQVTGNGSMPRAAPWFCFFFPILTQKMLKCRYMIQQHEAYRIVWTQLCTEWSIFVHFLYRTHSTFRDRGISPRIVWSVPSGNSTTHHFPEKLPLGGIHHCQTDPVGYIYNYIRIYIYIYLLNNIYLVGGFKHFYFP